MSQRTQAITIFIHIYLTASEWPHSHALPQMDTLLAEGLDTFCFSVCDSKEEAQLCIIRNEVPIFCWAPTYT